MIQIKSKKRGVCPAVLNNTGGNKITIETDSNNTLYDSFTADYNDRIRKWDIKTEIYGHSNIKNRLRSSQYGKCAFCESNVSSISHGDIEHFRPKKYWIQNDKKGEQGPGYYWLAYDFTNLLFSCQICNQRQKKNYFPIRRPEFRAHNHHYATYLIKEKPFFVNPIEENPKYLIGFKEAEAIGKDKNHRGKKTIKALGLNRRGEKGISDLYEMRLQHYQNTKNSYWMSNQIASSTLPQNMIDEAMNFMTELRSYKSQFSAMINENFPV
ncbi:hypothetical protein SD960_22550 [Flavobacterium sp. MMLR14_040]|uniref:hypothetical protein n=1 Tax=Flavobacterium sp. MMLR14_040 TaxID=3093843 RepID=UPI00299027A1|nr:hypothetical protein [Flavobacterium sp. MMLR14_040]MDW8852897.1 hypothetical protein [Flavobacterium sp. MMLR14_040]